MLVMQGPYPLNTSTIVLPSPNETNTEGLRATVQTIYKMDGSRNTYVKPKDGRKRYRWEVNVGHYKAKELENYFISNSGKLARVDWGDNTYIGYLTLNPFEMSGDVGEFFRIVFELEEA